MKGPFLNVNLLNWMTEIKKSRNSDSDFLRHPVYEAFRQSVLSYLFTAVIRINYSVHLSNLRYNHDEEASSSNFLLVLPSWSKVSIMMKTFDKNQCTIVSRALRISKGTKS